MAPMVKMSLVNPCCHRLLQRCGRAAAARGEDGPVLPGVCQGVKTQADVQCTTPPFRSTGFRPLDTLLSRGRMRLRLPLTESQPGDAVPLPGAAHRCPRVSG